MKTQKVFGTISFVFLLILTSLWAFWGIIENFHEGWFYTSFWKNIGLMFIQYLSPFLIFMLLSLISIRNNKIGSALFLLFGTGISFFVNRFNYFVILPFFIMAALIFFSRFENKKRMYRLIIFIPIILLIVFSIEPIYRVSTRLNDENFSAQTIRGNGIELVWAPRGPGWPDEGVNWYKADSICRYLNSDGNKITRSVQNIWRLPTVEEAVRSMQKHGKNCLGTLDKNGKPIYKIKPDKETPLWNPHTQVIYWWTSTETDLDHAYIVVYNGKIRIRNKNNSPNYLSFRAVKNVDK